MFTWYRQISSNERKTFWGCFAGWGLDALDVQMFTLAIPAIIAAFGFGGEWAAGAVLMAETIRSEHRGKAMGGVQSAWAIGWGGAVLLYTAMFSWLAPDIAWRVMFAIGLLPALLVVYVRRNLKEPPK